MFVLAEAAGAVQQATQAPPPYGAIYTSSRVTFATVVFPTPFYRNGDAEMSQSLLFRTMQPLSWAAFVSLE